MSSTYWTPRPSPGDIVECCFPEEVGVPGPKNRPALVLQVEEAPDDPTGSVVIVAYATSQGTASAYPGEFVIAADVKTGLTQPTKFDLVNHHRLPFDSKWFAPAPGKKPSHPCRGRLDVNDPVVKRKVQAAVTEAKQARRTPQRR